MRGRTQTPSTLLAAAALTVVLLDAVPATAAVVNLPASRDNTLYQDLTGSLSNGAGQYFFAGRTSTFTNAIRRAVIAFDIAGSIPAGSTIDGVTLTLHVSRVPVPVTTNTVTLHRVLAAWGEGDSAPEFSEGGGAPASPGDATWIHRFHNTLFWAIAGGDFAAGASASASVAGVGFYSWSSAAMRTEVQAWLDIPAGNFGWMLRGAEGTLESARGYDSRDHATAANRPVLTVSYTPPVVAGGAGRVPDGDQAAGLPLTIDHAAGGQIALSWGPSCAAGDTDYAIYEGSVAAFYSHGMRLCSTGGATTATFMPAPGDGYYLVVPRNSGREGSYGVRSGGAERPPGLPACLPQTVAACP